jgi:hypothetical protein
MANAAYCIGGRRILSPIFILLIILSASAAAAPLVSVSTNKLPVLIANAQNKTAYERLDDVFYEELYYYFTKSKRFKILERDNLDAILEEYEYNMTGIIEEHEQAIEVGNMLNASLMLFPAVNDAAYSMELSSRIEETKNTNGNVVKKEFYEVRTYSASVDVSARLIDASSGEILIQELRNERQTITRERITNSIEYDDEGEIVEEEKVESGWEFVGKMMLTVISQFIQEDRVDEEGMIAAVTEVAAKSVTLSILEQIPLRGFIFAKQGNDIYVDLGTDNGLKSRVNLRVTPSDEKRESQRLNAILQVDVVEDAYSVASFVRGNKGVVYDGAGVEVIDPVFRWDTALLSIVPGLGHFTHKFYGRGAFYFFSEAALIGGAVYLESLARDSNIIKYKTFDDTVWSVQDGSVKNGGTQYGSTKFARLFFFGGTIGLASIIYIVNIFDAGYLAEKNNPFAKEEGPRVYYAADPARMEHRLALEWRY